MQLHKCNSTLCLSQVLSENYSAISMQKNRFAVAQEVCVYCLVYTQGLLW